MKIKNRIKRTITKSRRMTKTELRKEFANRIAASMVQPLRRFRFPGLGMMEDSGITVDGMALIIPAKRPEAHRNPARLAWED